MSHLGDDVTILRFAADSTEDAYILLAEILKPLATGRLCNLPKPYMDRIHCLNEEELNSNKTVSNNNNESLSVNIGKKRDLDDLESTNSPVLTLPNNLGSAIIAMRKYDETLSNVPSVASNIAQ